MSPGAGLIVSCALASAGFATVVFIVFLFATGLDETAKPAPPECMPTVHELPIGEVFTL